MKIHFVFSPPNIQPRLGDMVEGMLPPMGIMYLASYLRATHNDLQLEIRATDGLVRNLEQTFSEVRAFAPDILCVSHLTAASLGAYELIAMAKREKPDLIVITGGPHSSALPEDVLERSVADVVVIGEGEVTLSELVRIVAREGKLNPADLEAVSGIAFRDAAGGIQRTSTRPYADLDSLTFPARDILPREDYHGYYLAKRRPAAPMMISRGCPADCVFCANGHWKLCKPYVRVRSPKNVVDEMEQLRELGYREVQDMGDELNNNVKNAVAICEEMLSRRMDLSWITCLRAHPLSDELVQLMARSGCWLVNLGIESGNPETLRGIGKNVTKQQIEDACRLLQKHGIKVQGLLMLFNVWESDDHLQYESVAMTENTLRFAEKLVDQRLVDYIGWSITTPYPGSELYDIACRHNLIKPRLRGNWDGWVRDDPFVMELPGISRADMAGLKRRGSIIRAKCMLKGGQVSFRDLPLLCKKATKVLMTELAARLGSLNLLQRSQR